MNHIGLFEGIGGFSLAARMVGWETIAWCEWNEFGQKILKYHFPEAEGFGDITKTDFTKYANTIDIVTGGFPCQPYSVAGKRKGKEDDRHLWPEMLRAIGEIQPSWVVGENVSGLLSWNGGLVFHEVQTDLEAKGYEVLPFILPACAVNAPHRRDRVWFIAYSNSCRNNRTKGAEDSIWEQQNKEQAGSRGPMQVDGFSDEQDASNSNSNGQYRGNSKHEINTSKRGFDALNDIEQVISTNTGSIVLERGIQTGKHEGQGKQIQKGREVSKYLHKNWGGIQFQNFPTQSPLCGGDDGLPRKLDGITIPKYRTESIKAYGNAIVPQVAIQIFKAIISMQKELA